MKSEYSIFDVADWFLHKKSFTHKQLQKLCYYAQAWHCALLDKPLFDEEFQAWIHGPVCPALYALYAECGWQPIKKRDGKAPKFHSDSLQLLNSVYRTYAKLNGAQLEALTHSELPWKKTRGDLEPYEPSNKIIPLDLMRNFYVEKYQQAQGD